MESKEFSFTVLQFYTVFLHSMQTEWIPAVLTNAVHGVLKV